MRALLLSSILLLVSPVQAADFIVHVPDELVEEGLRWNHFYSKHGKTNIQDDLDKKERLDFFLNKCVFDPSTEWILDSLIFAKTWGKVKRWKGSGITVEVKQDGS